MSKLEKVYLRLPIWLQNFAVSCAGWSTNHRRYDKSFERILREYKQREFDDEQTLTAYRDLRLRQFLRYAVDTIPYYREFFRSAGCAADDIRTLADLNQLPVLEKLEVQARQDELACKEFGPKEVVIHHTSGTTGAGLHFPATLSSIREQWAVWWRYRESHGITRTEKCLYFGGRSVVPLEQTKPPYWRYNLPGRQNMFSGYHLGPETSKDYLEEIRRSKLRWIHGYPSLISLLGQYAIELGMKTTMRWVTIGAESLLANQREVIREAFGVEPIQHYGMAEGVANISECPAGKLHVDEDYAAVEFLPTEDQGVYRIIGTGFANRAFSFIRYSVGDVVSLSNESCDCGRSGRLVEAIDGRQEDFVVMKNGAHLGRLDHIFKDCVNVKEAQLVQSEVGSMEVRVVKGRQYDTKDERQLSEEIKKRVGDFLEYSIKYVDRIERTRNGKLRFVVSEIQRNSGES